MIVEPDFFGHWKTRLFTELIEDKTAPLMVLRLWAHCQTRKKWKFQGLDYCALRAICNAEIDGGELQRCLVEAGFLRQDGDTLIVHDWEKTNRILVSAWKNGNKGGRPLKSLENRQVTGREPVGNRPLTGPSNLSSLSNPSVQKGDLKGKENGTDDLAWLAEIRDDPAYKGIDVAREHAKATRWCRENKRMMSRKFFVNWLNKCDKPMIVEFKPASRTTKYHEIRPEITDEQIAKNKAFIEKQKAELAEKLRMPG